MQYLCRRSTLLNFEGRMAVSSPRLRQISKFLPQIYSGNHCQPSGRGYRTFAAHWRYSPHVHANFNRNPEKSCFYSQRFSSVPKTLPSLTCESELLSFLQSTLETSQGPFHRWLNHYVDGKGYDRKDGVFLVLFGAFLDESLFPGRDLAIMLENIKALQQRYHSINVIGIQCNSSLPLDTLQFHLLQIAMREYITFPIVLVNKFFSHVTGGVCYILFKDFENPLMYFGGDADLGTVEKAVKELNVLQNGEPKSLFSESAWVKHVEVNKEPFICSTLQNSPLYFPGCISVDETGDRLFLSDTNHHRIIIFDGNGRILDCIGSAPGFEDGDFESSKLSRPAASFFHGVEGCLYFVDSENHAIRKADIERRVVTSIYPQSNTNDGNTLWSWIMYKLWMKSNVNTKSEEQNSESLLFPWHLLKVSDNDLFILNRSFETLWIMDMSSSAIKQVIKGVTNILEICEQKILEKSSLLKQIPNNLLYQQVDANISLEGIPYASLMSSIATYNDHIVLCDTVSQMVLKINCKFGTVSSFQFSKFAMLGLPYWFLSPLERVYGIGSLCSGLESDHIQHFSLLPGLVNIHVNVDISDNIELAEPLEEGCVWCQVRGAAVEVSRVKNKGGSSNKVGVAQQWYDELDNLAFSTPEVDFGLEEKSKNFIEQAHDNGVHIHCSVNTSPGTSEVIIIAALYLKLKNSSSCEENQEKKATKIVDLLNAKRKRKICRSTWVEFFSKSNRNLGEFVFIRPLHLRLKFDCGNHPKADNSKDIILTDTSVSVNVCLQ